MKYTLQEQYDIIYDFFKNTTEPFDELDWDGILLFVLFNGKVIEQYTLSDLK